MGIRGGEVNRWDKYEESGYGGDEEGYRVKYKIKSSPQLGEYISFYYFTTKSVRNLLLISGHNYSLLQAIHMC